MSSTSYLLSRSLLIAGAVALPLFGGAVLAQTAQPAAGGATATAAPATAVSKVSADKSQDGKAQNSKVENSKPESHKQLGAIKATPAEKKAMHEKTVATNGKTADVKHPNLTKQ